ncbi:hypothetical protein BDM02DRAFT_3263999 [Thelephora ganbajun]|uniref:Uncharacterized protein n=1 Tax=Thelephora ganbajun TaxID=370292 RepID=A0ACB6Z2A7_THEGA|nr:hypothetical protein BDM02DRAFT_3263999 [Thelephora ganbajun]
MSPVVNFKHSETGEDHSKTPILEALASVPQSSQSWRANSLRAARPRNRRAVELRQSQAHYGIDVFAMDRCQTLPRRRRGADVESQSRPSPAATVLDPSKRHNVSACQPLHSEQQTCRTIGKRNHTDFRHETLLQSATAGRSNESCEKREESPEPETRDQNNADSPGGGQNRALARLTWSRRRTRFDLDVREPVKICRELRVPSLGESRRCTIQTFEGERRNQGHVRRKAGRKRELERSRGRAALFQ